MTDIHQYISVIRETCLADALASSLLVVFSISVDYLGSESGRSLSLGVGYRIWYVLDTNFFSKTGLRLGALTQVQSSRTPKINGSVKREFSQLSCSQLSQVFLRIQKYPSRPTACGGLPVLVFRLASCCLVPKARTVFEDKRQTFSVLKVAVVVCRK